MYFSVVERHLLHIYLKHEFSKRHKMGRSMCVGFEPTGGRILRAEHGQFPAAYAFGMLLVFLV